MKRLDDKMRAVGYCLLTVVALLVSCSKETDLYDESKKEEADNNKAFLHAEQTIGVKIDKNHDWVLSTKSSLRITPKCDMPVNVKEVQVLSGNPYLGKATLLGRSSVVEGASAIVKFQAPSYLKQLYAASVDADGRYRAVPFVIGQETLTIDDNTRGSAAAARAQKAPSTNYGISGPLTTTNARLFGWGDKKYYIRKPAEVNYRSTWFTDLKREAHLFLPEGMENYDSIQKHPELGNGIIEVDEKGGEVVVSFIGGASNVKDHLGYCYAEGDGDVKTLHKFIFDRNYDPYNYYQADYSVTPTEYSTRQQKLLYQLSDGSFTTQFPANTKITWFIEREVYQDEDPAMFFGNGQLNSEVCQWLGNTAEEGHYDPSYAKSPDRSRIVVFSVNGHNFVSCEDGSNWDFNDKMFWVSGAVKVAPEPVPSPEVEPQVWTYAFEDSPMGDYDMNDVVVQAKVNEKDASKLDISLRAIGAKHDIWVFFNDNNQDVFGNEVHDVLGIPHATMANTDGNTAKTVSVTLPRPAGFDFQTNSFFIRVQPRGEETSYDVMVPTKGEKPHGVVIPEEWYWPKEQVCIVKAYYKFAEWAKDITNPRVKDWYLEPDKSKVVIR